MKTRIKPLIFIGCALLLGGCAALPPATTALTLDSGAERAPEQLAVVFEQADLALRIDPASRSIVGDATLTLRSTATLNRIVLDLDRSLPVDSISIDGVLLPAGAWSNPQGRLSITLPQPLLAGERSAVRVRYHGQPHVARNAPWDGGWVWSTAPDGSPWIASAVQGEGCDLFWPCIDHPAGKPGKVVQHITVPAPLVAAGNGVSLGMDQADGWNTWHWSANTPSTYGIAINVGPYQLLSDDYASRFGNHYPLRFWYLRGSKAKAEELFTEFKPMLDFFERRIGPYPFGNEKMGVVETPHKGMEHQTINAYGNNYAKIAYGYDDLLQHELAHEWFGNQMTNGNWDDMWLHEGFASYMQPLYMQDLRGDQDYFAALQRMRAGIRNQAPLVSGQPRTEEQVYEPKRGGPGGDIYSKGALLLHSLRALIGDEAFFRATRRLVYGTATPQPGNFQPRYASSAEFIDLVRQESGRDLDWFFQVYLYQAALPELRTVQQGDTLLLSWHTAGTGTFPMPVEVKLGSSIVTVAMDGGQGQLKLAPGTAYTLDPHSKLLRREVRFEEFQKYTEEQAKVKKK